MEAAAGGLGMMILYALAVAVEVFPLAVLISFAPALLAASFFFITTSGKPSGAFSNAAVALFCSFIGIAAISGAGLYVIGSKPGARSEADMVRSLVMQYTVHSVVFYVVGFWLVLQTWKRSPFAAGLLAILIVAAELTLLLSEPFPTAVLEPVVALSHVAAYVVLLVAVVWWTKRSRPTRQPT